MRWLVMLDNGSQILFETDVDCHDIEVKSGDRFPAKLHVGGRWLDVQIQLDWDKSCVVASWPAGGGAHIETAESDYKPETTHVACSTCWPREAKARDISTDEDVVEVNRPAVDQVIGTTVCCFCAAVLAEKSELDVVFVFKAEPAKIPCLGVHPKGKASP